ncbi:chemotaxis response regulator protein-glutamate methylesterase [Sporosarcina saromensis]|uniref:chemotaxis response regulator protein-glutamate methylesterase n=1 Tax=Sporosarcina saromensis TaxID=359365 RepID=UPI0037DA139B
MSPDIQRKKVLVVDDSAFMRKLISDMLSNHPSLTVVATARNGQDALAKVEQLCPDVITMDIEMPVMDGLEALQQIMKTTPTPIVMLSSTTEIGAKNTMLAMEYGAVDFVAKPGGPISLNLSDVEAEIVKKVVQASTIKVATLTKKREVQKNSSPQFNMNVRQQRKQSMKQDFQPFYDSGKKMSKQLTSFVIIGTSTGGPRALQAVLTELPKSIPAPILVVQHMPPGFTKSLAQRLDGLSEIHVKEAEDGEPFVNGTAYIAPGGKHLTIDASSNGYNVRLDEIEPPRKGHRPAVDVLLESASNFPAIQFLSVIMTGMGHDGKEGLQTLKASCNTIAIAESERTSIVYGMPKAIRDAGLADQVVDLEEIPTVIMNSLHS